MALAVTPALAQEPSAAPLERIAGQVVQATAGAELPADLEVTLTILDADGALLSEVVQPVGADGGFSFVDLPGEPAFPDRYRVSVAYGDLRRTVLLEEAADPVNIELLIFEATSSPDDIVVRTHSTVIEGVDADQGLVGVLELVVLVNAGDRAFTPDMSTLPDAMPELLTFGLPPGYRGLSVETSLPGDTFVEMGNGFGLVTPVPPGEYQLMLSYTAPYEGDYLEFSRPLPYGAGELRFLTPEGIGTVSGHGLVLGEDAVIGGATYNVMSGKGYPRGTGINLRVAGLPRASLAGIGDKAEDGTAWWIIVVPALTAAAMAALLGYSLYRRSRRPAAPATISGGRAAVVREIAALDDRFAAGELEEAEYRQLREGLMARALRPAAPATISGGRVAVVQEIAALDDRFGAGELEETEYGQLREGLMARALRAADDRR